MSSVAVADPYTSAWTLGVLAAGTLAWRDGARAGHSVGLRAVLVTAVFVAGLAGAHLLPLGAHLPHDGEKTILGALLGGSIAVAAVAAWSRRGAALFDVLLPAAPVGMAIGRVGCWLVGCCAGTPTALPWGTRYAAGTPPFAALVARGLVEPGASATMPLHPVQLYEALGDLALAALVLRLPLRARAARPLAFALGYALLRAGLEFLRVAGEPVGGLKPVQWGLLGSGALLLVWLVLRERATAVSGSGTRTRPADRPVAVALGACATLLLLPPDTVQTLAGVGSPDSLFPREYLVIGGSGALSGSRTRATDCEGNTLRTRDHAFAGGSLGVGFREERSADAGVSVTGSVLAGRVTSEPERRVAGTSTGPLLPADTAGAGGVVFAVTSDWRWIGVTAGSALGRFPLPIGNDNTNELESASWLPVAGVRIGPLSKAYFEILVMPGTDPNPYVTLARMGMGFAVGSRGGRFSVGATNTGAFLAGHFVTHGDWEVEPTVVLGSNGSAAQLGVRRRLTLGRGVPP